MTHRHVVVDLDSTTVELCSEWYRQYNETYGDDLTIEKVLTWDTHRYAKHGHKVYEILDRPGFFRNLPPMPGAIAALKALHDDGNRITIATTSSRNGGFDKLEWVDEHLPFIGWKKVKLLHEKEAKGDLRGDVLIDDGPHNIDLFRASNPHSFITGIQFPYNWGTRANILINDYRNPQYAWGEILNEVRDYLQRTDV